ncbi:15846_t:CDS:1, partial [Cetraspora pellucida]
NQIIKRFAYVFKNDENAKVTDEKNTELMDEEKDDSVESVIVSGNSALSSLKNVWMFLLQQESLNE